MKNKTFKYILSILLLTISIGGIIVFFPARMNGEYTCICDRMLGNSTGITPDSFALLIERFFFPFAFMWWGSILLAVLCSVYIIKMTMASGRGERKSPENS